MGLRDAGHEVVVASHWMFAEQITGCGLEFRQMPLNIDIDITDTDIDCHHRYRPARQSARLAARIAAEDGVGLAVKATRPTWPRTGRADPPLTLCPRALRPARARPRRIPRPDCG